MPKFRQSSPLLCLSTSCAPKPPLPPPLPPLLQCTIYKTLDNQDVWAYDKRFHTALEESLTVPAIEAPPAFQARLWLAAAPLRLPPACCGCSR